MFSKKKKKEGETNANANAFSYCHVEVLLKLPLKGTKQRVEELRVEKVHHVGPMDPTKYPLPKTRLTLEFLRDIVHFRSRTNMVLSLFMFLLICLVIVNFF